MLKVLITLLCSFVFFFQACAPNECEMGHKGCSSDGKAVQVCSKGQWTIETECTETEMCMSSETSEGHKADASHSADLHYSCVEMTTHEATAGEMTTHEATAGEMTMHEPTAGEMAAGEQQ